MCPKYTINIHRTHQFNGHDGFLFPNRRSYNIGGGPRRTEAFIKVRSVKTRKSRTVLKRFFFSRSVDSIFGGGRRCCSSPTMPKGGRPARIFPSRRSTSSSTLVFAVLLMLSVVLLMLLALGILSLPVDKGNDSPKTPNHGIKSQTRDGEDLLGERGSRWTEVISWEPRAFVYHNFLSEEECKHLIELAKPHMEKSTVVDSATGQSKDSRVRTSSGMFLKRGRDKIIRDIEKRIADFTFIPVDHGEGLQVLHYEVGQKYEPHYDYFIDEYNTRNGGQRIATVLMYLSDVEEGGETIFPNANVNSSSLPWYNELSECGKRGLSVKPKMGDALLFWSMRPDATLDPLSLHGGCPVIKGNKWSSTKWIRVNEYRA